MAGPNWLPNNQLTVKKERSYDLPLCGIVEIIAMYGNNNTCN